MSLTVLEPGLASRIVDAGRPRSRSLGVPVGGAADQRSLVLGNSLIGNAPDLAALEIALKGPRLQADADVGCVLFGAPFEAHRDGYRIEIGQSFTLHAGEALRIGGTATGARAYLCVRGGFVTPLILASRSGLEAITRGDVLQCESSTIRTRSCPMFHVEHMNTSGFAVLAGQQAAWFEEAEFYEQTFTVTPASNRMGLRLHGRALTMPRREMISEPVCPGAIQVTPDGQCIVLGVDGQTIGGYPKIAQVIHADLDTLGQLRPGQSIRFRKIALTEATDLARQADSKLRQAALRLRLSLDAFPAERKFASS